MNLAAALIDLAPPADASSPEERALRVRAMEVLFEELQTLARGIASFRDPEDIASEVLCRLTLTGPRRGREMPASEAAARQYLRQALRHRAIDVQRRAKRHEGLPPDDELPPAPDASHPAPADDELRVLTEARRALYTRALPAIARNGDGRFDGAGFAATILEMRALFREETTIEQLLMRTDRRVTSAGRNRLYKRHERARARLLVELPQWLAAGDLDPIVDTAVRAVAQTELAPRVQRRGVGA